MEMRRKAYVKVIAEFDAEGNITPQSLEWEDGTTYAVDRVLGKARRASLKAGGSGIRYHIRVGWETPEGGPAHAESYLFLEDDGRWFVEAKQ